MRLHRIYDQDNQCITDNWKLDWKNYEFLMDELVVKNEVDHRRLEREAVIQPHMRWLHLRKERGNKFSNFDLSGSNDLCNLYKVSRNSPSFRTIAKGLFSAKFTVTSDKNSILNSNRIYTIMTPGSCRSVGDENKFWRHYELKNVSSHFLSGFLASR